MARTDYQPGANPTLSGPHVLAVLSGEAADDLAALVVPTVAVASTVDEVVAAVSASSAFGNVDFAVVQFLGSHMIARLRGDRLSIVVSRRDGLEARYTARGSAIAELTDDDYVRVEVVDTLIDSDGVAAVPLPFGWEASSRVSFQPNAVLSGDEHDEWVENSTSSVRFEPPTLRGLEFADGRRLIVDREVLIGRSPQAIASSTGESPAVFTVESPNRDISRTHLRISTDGSKVLLEDLNSTNGTEVTPRDGHSYLLEPGQPALLDDGAVVTLGNKVTFTVVEVE